MKNLKNLRKMTGLTQEQFSDAIGIGRTYLNQLETIESKEPSKALKDKIYEVIVKRVIVPARRLMSVAARSTDSAETIDRLKKLEIRGFLPEHRVLLMDIEDANREPVIVPADWAVRIWETNLQHGKWIDVLYLYDYDLDELVGRK